MELKDIKDAATEAIAPLKKQLEDQKADFALMLKDKADEVQMKALEISLHETANSLKAVQEQLDALEEKGLPNTKEKEVSLASELKSKVFTKDNIVKMKSGYKLNFDDINIKAVSDMTRAYSATSGLRDIFAEVEAGISKSPKKQPTILDYIRIGSTNSEILKWVVKTLQEGAIGQTAEAAKFSQMSFKWDKEQASAKKTTGYAKVSKENLEDVEFTLQETLTELREEFLLKIADQVMNGDNVGENHNGILNQATSFARQVGVNTLTGVTMRDVLEHAYLQIRVAGKGAFRANAIMLNPVDVTKLKTLKDTTGQYIMPLYLSNTGYDVNGIPIVENDSIAADDFLIGDFTKYGWFNYRNLNIQTYDQNEDDVLKDFITIAGSLRAISRIKTPELPAFVKGKFTTAITALQV